MRNAFYLIAFVVVGILWGVGMVLIPIGRESPFLFLFGIAPGVPFIALLMTAFLCGLPAALAVGVVYAIIDRTRIWMVVAALLLTEVGSFVMPCLYFVALSRVPF